MGDRRQLRARHAPPRRHGRRQIVRSSPPARNLGTSLTPIDQRFGYAVSAADLTFASLLAAGNPSEYEILHRTRLIGLLVPRALTVVNEPAADR
jgi:hypothetical protein